MMNTPDLNTKTEAPTENTPAVELTSAEQQRLEAQRRGAEDWQLWGPYLSERAWGTVREDYSADGTAWEYFSHDQSRSRAYRWNAPGGRCARITAPMARRGNISATINRVRAPIAGARTAWAGSATHSNGCVSR